jgi:hypothetical protein
VTAEAVSGKLIQRFAYLVFGLRGLLLLLDLNYLLLYHLLVLANDDGAGGTPIDVLHVVLLNAI